MIDVDLGCRYDQGPQNSSDRAKRKSTYFVTSVRNLHHMARVLILFTLSHKPEVDKPSLPVACVLQMTPTNPVNGAGPQRS